MIGLDIGSSSVKAVELESKGRGSGFELSHMGVAKLPSEAIVQGAFLNSSAIADAIRDHESEHDLRFILTGGEEQGLFGSRYYIENLTVSERGRIKAVVNMDMIGFITLVDPHNLPV